MPKHQWQYNGVATMAELVDWCEKHVRGEYVYHGWETIVFHTGRAHAMFLLRWA
jgi:hypothetical protein